MIRELREEVEKLRSQLTLAGSGEGGGASPKELEALHEKLRLSEHLFSEMTMTWEQKLAEANRIHMVGVVSGCGLNDALLTLCVLHA